MSYTSSFTGSQIDEAVDKVINNKIGKADWNAQKGEAGYIENRTHYLNAPITKELGINPIYDESGSFVDVSVGGGYHQDNNVVMIEDNTIIHLDIEGYTVDNFIITPNGRVDVGYFEMETFHKIATAVTEEYEESLYLKLDIEPDYKDTFYEYPTLCTYITIKTLGDIYLPNTVLKTTPQTLSDTDKNQALANLGIDPVVWKYLCNPFVININGEECYVPEELVDLDSLFDSADYGIVYGWKYVIPAMYVGFDEMSARYYAVTYGEPNHGVPTLGFNDTSIFIDENFKVVY